MSSTRSLRQAGWATFEYASFPVLILLVTPFFLGKLGEFGYGKWMLLMALSGVGGLAGFGVGAATTREVSAERGRGRPDGGAATVVPSALSVALLGSVLVALLYILIWMLLPSEVSSKIGVESDIFVLLLFSIVIIFFDQIDVVYTGVIRGFERFDAGARAEIVAKFCSVVLYISVVSATGVIEMFFLSIAGAAAAKAAVKAYVASKVSGVDVICLRWDPHTVRRLLSFGKWTWAQAIGASLFAAADRLLIGAILGTESLARYAVMSQLAQQIHTIPAAASAILFPLISRKVAGKEAIRNVLGIASMSVVSLVIVIALPLYLFGAEILSWWVSGMIPRSESVVFELLVAAFSLLALSIVPHYALLGLNRAKAVAVINIVAGITSLWYCMATLPSSGLIGGAQAKIAFSVLLAAAFIGYVLSARKGSRLFGGGDD